MGADDSIPKFFNPEMAPAPGGWHYWLDPENKQYPVNAHSSQGVFDALKRYQTNNRKFTGDAAVWRQLWGYWCSLEPKRCGERNQREVIVGELPGKKVWGPILWKMLNWAAVNYRTEFFALFVQEMRTRLIVCDECRGHFDEILIRYPVAGVFDVLSACRWVNAVHNEVNRIVGKPHYPYSQAITEFGFPTP